MEIFNSITLNPEELQELIEKACDYALLTGMGMRSLTDMKTNCIQFTPFMLFPSWFPREEYNNACDTQIILNLLMHHVANDHEFLKIHLQDIIRVDSFTEKLYKIYETVHKEGLAQNLSLTLLRSDLMLDSVCFEDQNCNQHKTYCCWKQVEINTIASGHGWLGPCCSNFHRFILKQLDMTSRVKNLPENNALTGICSGIVETWKMYGDLSAVVLFVIEKDPYNICDQRMHEFEVTRLCPKIRVIRKTLEQLVDEALLGPNKELLVNHSTVAVVYFRSGYSPGQYPTDKEWDVRLLIERSKAVKSPSIQYHLAGTKKIQQVLASPGVIKKFLKETNDVNQIKKIFTGLYSLDFDDEGDAAVEMGIQNPNRFIMKPQREGGGNNLFGADVEKFLKSVRDKKERVSWILMDKIRPPIQTNYMVKPFSDTKADLKECTSELGIFGVLISDPRKVYVNRQVGHTMRTKLASANEGGVSSGHGAMDSPYLI